MNKKLKPTLPLAGILGLALLTIPRVPIHDLKLMSFDSLLYKALAVVPLLIWFLVAVFRKSTRPFYDFVVVGLTYGLFLGVTHQILWDASWGGNVPQLGGNLTNVDPTLENIILRTAAMIGSLMTGLFTGALFGLVALIANKLRGQSQPNKKRK